MNQPRAAALGRELVAIHDQLRNQLDELRQDPPAADGRSLQVHCLAFCSAITRHHSAEDHTAFPTLADRYPDLAPVLAELEHDHRLIADLIRQVDVLLASPAERATLGAHLDGLAAVLDSHFGWEERRLVAALDKLDGTSSAAELFGVP